LKVQEPDSRKECPTLGVYNSSTVSLEWNAFNTSLMDSGIIQAMSPLISSTLQQIKHHYDPPHFHHLLGISPGHGAVWIWCSEGGSIGSGWGIWQVRGAFHLWMIP
jgi:hypothetical protein